MIDPHWFDSGMVYLDFTSNNSELANPQFDSAAYSQRLLDESGCKLAIGRYGEDRAIYNFEQYKSDEEPRTVHMGLDVNLPAGEPIYAPADCMIHSFANNNSPGDYGPTIILRLSPRNYLLLGHLSLPSLSKLYKGMKINFGDIVGFVGAQAENGGWVPHVHIQLIQANMSPWNDALAAGNFPGVCKKSEWPYWKKICPDPSPLLIPPGAISPPKDPSKIHAKDK